MKFAICYVDGEGYCLRAIERENYGLLDHSKIRHVIPEVKYHVVGRDGYDLVFSSHYHDINVVEL